MTIVNFVMSETRCSTADWDCFRMLTFLGDLEKLKIAFGWNLVHLWQSHVCSHKLDVYETNFSLTQFDGIRKKILLMQFYAWTEFPLSISGIWSLKYCILLPTKYSDTKRVRWERRNLQRNKQSSRHTTEINIQTPHKDLKGSNVD